VYRFYSGAVHTAYFHAAELSYAIGFRAGSFARSSLFGRASREAESTIWIANNVLSHTLELLYPILHQLQRMSIPADEDLWRQALAMRTVVITAHRRLGAPPKPRRKHR